MTTETDLQTFMADCRVRVEQALDHWLPSAQTLPDRLHAAMRYSTLGGGKRIRPVLCYAAGQALGVAPQRLDGPACAVELIHAYSLIHDDLPAMDDDDLRRGRPTCHRAYDEATAILAGDALQTLAFQVLCKDETMQADATAKLRMIETLAQASGSRGMAGGQALDLAAVGQDIDLAQLENMHIHKTGALIRTSVQLAVLSAPDLDDALGLKLDHYAKCIGLAFQVWDDVLDVEGDTQTLGKTQGKDEAQSKPTYPALLGLDGARDMAELLRQEALHSLSELDERAAHLRALADYIVDRNH